jgi:hypothetical protein
MIHFLRTQQNRTLIECEVYKDDLHTSTNLTEYSLFLLNSENKEEVISDFSSLDEIRGWWWEKEEMMGDWKSIDEFVKTKFVEIADKYDLRYVTD